MVKRMCSNCGEMVYESLNICPYCLKEFKNSEEITKDEALKFLRKVSALLVIMGIIGIIFGWMAIGAFGFLFLPFVFWEKLGRVIRKTLEKS